MKVAATKSAAEIAATGDASVAFDEESKIAGYLSDFGLNLNLGIVADIYREPAEGETAASAYGRFRCVLHHQQQYRQSKL